MKNPHLFNKLLNWFACFGHFDEELTEASILQSLHAIHEKMDKQSHRHKDRDCYQKLSASTLLIILAMHHLKNPKDKLYSDAKDAIKQARLNLYHLQYKKEHSHFSCRADHTFFSLHREMREVNDSIEKLSELENEQEFTQTTAVSASMN